MSSRHPSTQDIKVAADAAIFTVRDGRLEVLLIRMKKKPFTGAWALPGGLLGDRETSEAAARRILSTQTGVTEAHLEQLATFDAVDRDPLGRVVSVAWMALVPSEGVTLRTTEKYADVAWHPVSKLPALAYDHREVAMTAIARLRARLGYTNIVWSLLPETFTLAELQDVYEAILGETQDKRNFRKRILAAKLLKATGKEERSGAHRPAALYRFAKKGLHYVDIL